jgi:hypothetical protein
MSLLILWVYSKRGERVFSWLKEGFFPHMLVRAILEGSLNFSLCSLINLRRFHSNLDVSDPLTVAAAFNNWTDGIAFVVSLTFLGVLVGFGIFIPVRLGQAMKARGGEYPFFESIYGEVRAEQDWWAL